MIETVRIREISNMILTQPSQVGMIETAASWIVKLAFWTQPSRVGMIETIILPGDSQQSNDPTLTGWDD